jgi:hypothetical protein
MHHKKEEKRRSCVTSSIMEMRSRAFVAGEKSNAFAQKKVVQARRMMAIQIGMKTTRGASTGISQRRPGLRALARTGWAIVGKARMGRSEMGFQKMRRS